MREVPGEDQYGAPLPTLLRLVSILVDLQAEWIGAEGELLALGLPDWRSTAMTQAIGSVVSRNATGLSETSQPTSTASPATSCQSSRTTGTNAGVRRSSAAIWLSRAADQVRRFRPRWLRG
jgi:hypothetical protein